jgi:hypothetical protein
MPGKKEGEQHRKIPFASVGMEECARKGADRIGWEASWKNLGQALDRLNGGWEWPFSLAVTG